MTTLTQKLFEVRRVDNVTTKASTLVGTVMAVDHEDAQRIAVETNMIGDFQTFRVVEAPDPTKEYEGWVITHDYFDDPGRVGWGQREVEAFVTEQSFDTVIGRTVEMHTELSTLVKDPVVWRLKQDDEPVYAGIVSASWVLGDDDHAYNITRFCEADVGGGDLEFRAKDLPVEFIERLSPCIRNGWLTLY